MSELERLRMELESERRARKHAEAALEAARQDAIARSRFLAGMGHSMRSPLNAVLGYSEILLENASGSLNERQRGYVERIGGSGQRQLELVNNLMALAELQAGDVDLVLEPLKVADLVHSTASDLRASAEEKGLTLGVRTETEDVWVQADGGYLARALSNVLGNAIRFSKAPGDVCVSVASGVNGGRTDGRTDGRADWLTVAVSDDGPGIAVAEQELIFDDFEEGQTFGLRRDRHFGLGLPLARRIVELHGGQICVESEGRTGAGSRFLITLPATGCST